MNRRKFVGNIGKSLLVLNVLPHILSYYSASKKRFLMGKSKNPNFTKIEHQYVENETAIHYQKLKQAAKKDGIQVQLVSAYRSFSRQKEIFEAKFSQFENSTISQLEAIQQITQYSSIPGTSRHHWGTDLDLIQHKSTLSPQQNVLQATHFEPGGMFSELHQWMQEHAASFGFYLTYTHDEQRTGYNYEPWHYSYLPKAKVYLAEYMKFDMAEEIHSEDIKGLSNLELDFFKNYISNYVLGINSIFK